MEKVAVRRINEWDGPAMLKIYGPYCTASTLAEEEMPPSLGDYIQRIDRYTYGLGWLMCEIDSIPAGFCHLREDRRDPENLFSVEFCLYVKPEFQRRCVGKALYTLMERIMEYGHRREVTVRICGENPAARQFFQAMGFVKTQEVDSLEKFGEPLPVEIWRKTLSPQNPQAVKPIKPYLIENSDYEAAREQAAALVRE